MTISKNHPTWWIQKSTTDCGREIKIICNASHSRDIPEHVFERCCNVYEYKELLNKEKL